MTGRTGSLLRLMWPGHGPMRRTPLRGPLLLVARKTPVHQAGIIPGTYLILCILALAPLSVVAQPPPPPGQVPQSSGDPLDILPDLGGFSSGGSFGARVGFSGTFRVKKGSRDGQLSIQALIEPGWHLYSTTQPSGGPQRTDIRVTASPEFQVLGDFSADRDPLLHPDPAFPGVRIEEFENEVTWTAPIRLSEGVDPAKLRIKVIINGQVCETGGTCDLIQDEPVEPEFAGFYDPPSASGVFKDEGGKLTIRGHIEPKIAAPGDAIMLVLTAELDRSWHVYRYAPTAPEKGSRPTLIVLRKTSGWKYGVTESSVEPQQMKTGLQDEPILYYHEGTVTWTIPIQVPQDAAPGEYEILGAIGYQTCTHEGCEMPRGAQFRVRVPVSTKSVNGTIPLAFSTGDYDKIAADALVLATAASTAGTASNGTWSDKSLWAVLGLAFLAGLILNVMPCVLPVIGLKIMSFVQQAGESRFQILSLNLWFSLGLLSVFWILAGAAAFANMGWGEHFGNAAFTVTMIGIVFAFGLSFLGIWEIPIPGFVGSGTIQGTAAKEGAVGAFSKGVLSTVLATPCAGPLLVPAVSWAVAQPAWLTFLAFNCVGFGMATPYLLIGAFPKLIHVLPKPGPWMDTFKQVMGFLLLGTVIFLFGSVEQKFVIPTLVLLLGIGIGCWWIGRTPMTADLRTRLRGWAGSAAFVVAGAVIGFVLLVPWHLLDWQPYSRAALDQHLAEGRTVLVDFTAHW